MLIQTRARRGLARSRIDTWEWGVRAGSRTSFMPIDRGLGLHPQRALQHSHSPGEDLVSGNDSQLTYWGFHAGFCWEQY